MNTWKQLLLKTLEVKYWKVMYGNECKINVEYYQFQLPLVNGQHFNLALMHNTANFY